MSSTNNTNGNGTTAAPAGNGKVPVLKSPNLHLQSSLKQQHGPMKATIPMSSLLKKQLITGPHSSVPSTSPTMTPLSPWKPEHSGLRSPGSTINKSKTRSDKSTNLNCMRRSASLDAIYLQGHWPRENVYVPQLLQVDKATQTDEHDWLEMMETRKISMIAVGEPQTDTNGNEKLEKYIRQKLQLQRCSNNPHLAMSVTGNMNRSHSQTSPTGTSLSVAVPVVGDHTLNTSSQTHTSCLIPRALPVNIPIKPLPKPTMRNSVEGLNQEIERLVLKSDGGASHAARDKGDEYDKVTPEGHRAPFPDLYRNTRSVNTQTPSATDLRGSCHSSSPPSRDSVSPLLMIPGQIDTSPSDADGSRGSSPDQEYSPIGKLGTSPRLFMARGPPDGCERVHLRTESKASSMSLLPPTERSAPMPQPCTATAFKLQPSQGSAFQLLQPAHQPADIPIVPAVSDNELI